MTIEDKLTTIGESLQDIKQAIINKGQTVTGNITTYADKINDIQSGVTPTGTLSITANGVYDVTNYASANVSVSSGTSDWVITNNFTISGKKSYFKIEDILDTVGYRIVGEDSNGVIKVVGCLYDANGNVIVKSNGHYLVFSFEMSEYYEGDEASLTFYDEDNDVNHLIIHIELS